MQQIRDTKMCPTTIRVGVMSKWSVNFPSLRSLLSWLSPFITHNADDLKNHGYAVMTLGSGYVYIVDEETYNDKYKEYEDGVIEGFLISSVIGNGTKIYKWLDEHLDAGGWGLIAAVPGGLLSGPISEIIDLIKDSDGLRFFSYEESVTFGIARYTGPYATYNINCPNIEPNFVLYRQAIGDYNACTNGTCKQAKKKEIDKIQSNLQTYCGTVLKTKSYNDTEKSCLLNCLNMTEILNDYRKDTDLYNDKMYQGDTCGLPVKLIIWIENILRWVKYLIPVV